MLRVEHMSCGYSETPIVRDVTFHVREGERLCILGPNGCGKTTMLRALAGLLSSTGTIEVMGEDIRKMSYRERARKIALMSQLAPAAFEYTVYETVMLGRYAHRKGGPLAAESEADHRAVKDSLTLTGTWEVRDRLISELSGGQLQRVYLARTFAQQPQVIMLDEPTNHLDLRYQVELIESLREWSRVAGHCVVGVLHDINLALAFADTVLLLDHGSVLAYEPVDKFDLDLLNQLYGMDVRDHMKNALQRWK